MADNPFTGAPPTGSQALYNGNAFNPDNMNNIDEWAGRSLASSAQPYSSAALVSNGQQEGQPLASYVTGQLQQGASNPYGLNTPQFNYKPIENNDQTTLQQTPYLPPIYYTAQNAYAQPAFGVNQPNTATANPQQLDYTGFNAQEHTGTASQLDYTGFNANSAQGNAAQLDYTKFNANGYTGDTAQVNPNGYQSYSNWANGNFDVNPNQFNSNSSQMQATMGQAAQGQVDPNSMMQNQFDQVMNSHKDAQGVPDWAQTAVTAANQRMNSMGLGASTMAGNATAQAILNTALPMAAANSQVVAQLNSQNLSNSQQSMLSNQAYANAASQFNAQSDQQNKQFFASLTSNIAQNNASRDATIAQFNAGQSQQNSQFNSQLSAGLASQNAQMSNAMNQFNAGQQQQNSQYNNTLSANIATNDINAQNTMNQFNAGQQQQSNQFNTNLSANIATNDINAQNTMNQFNAGQVQQNNQFNSTLGANIATNDINTANQMGQFNATQQNAASQFFGNLQQQTSLTNAQLITQTSQFNTNQDNAAAQFINNLDSQQGEFNLQNQQLVNQSNVQWQRAINTANTAGDNATNQANVMNAFNIQQTDLNNLWQQARDEASWSLTSSENAQNRDLTLVNSALNRQTSLDILNSQMNASMFSALGSFGVNVLGGALGGTGANGIGQGISNAFNVSGSSAANQGNALQQAFANDGIAGGTLSFD